MVKLNQDSFVVDEVLTALVGDGEKDSKKESKKDKKPKESKKDSKKDKKSKDKKSDKKEKEIKIVKNDKADTDGDIIDIEIEDVKEVLENQYKQKPQGVRMIDNKVLLFTELIQSISNVKPNDMCNTLGKETFVQFVEWAIENKHSVPTEYLEKSIDIKDALDSSTKKSKDKKSDKKDKKKKSKDKDKKKDKKDKDKKSDKKDKKKKSKKDDDDKKSKKKGRKKDKKKKSKPTTDDEDIKRAFKKAKKQDKQEEEILSDADIDALTTIEINFDL